MKPRITLLALAASFLLSHSVAARTWYVAADGSGEAPTVHAAVDSSVSGDVILVGPGTHLIHPEDAISVIVKPGTSLVSESGPLTTILQGLMSSQHAVVGLTDGCLLKGFTIRNALWSVYCVDGNNEIAECIVERIGFFGTGAVHHNIVDGGVGALAISGGTGGSTEIRNNIILGSIVGCSGGELIYCNDITTANSCGPLGESSFSADPMFCGPENYYLNAMSPCAPGNHPNGISQCGQIGPLPVGCGPVGVKATTWGAVKALYRN